MKSHFLKENDVVLSSRWQFQDGRSKGMGTERDQEVAPRRLWGRRVPGVCPHFWGLPTVLAVAWMWLQPKPSLCLPLHVAFSLRVCPDFPCGVTDRSVWAHADASWPPLHLRAAAGTLFLNQVRFAGSWWMCLFFLKRCGSTEDNHISCMYGNLRNHRVVFSTE